MASGRQTDDRDTPDLCTEFESVNDDWDLISGQPLRPCGYQHRKSKAGQMTASTNCCNVKIVLAMWASSTDAQVDIVSDPHGRAVSITHATFKSKPIKAA